MRFLSHACMVLLALALGGCETLSYYRQGLVGEVHFYGARQPIAKVLQRADLAPDTRRRLELVPQIRAFAKSELKLPVKGQYRDYVQLNAPNVAWSVFAAPELSLEPYRWCYGFHALCMEYRGYFHEADAQAYAAKLAARGYDTHIGGVSAFSSLGLFDDPVTSVLTAYPDDVLALVLFHEFAHSVLYVQDDTSFNESFAEAVGEEGLRRWLAARSGQPGTAAGGIGPVVARMQAQQELMTAIALETRARLAAVYASADDDATRRARKQEILAAAATEYEARCVAADAGNGAGACPYRAWFAHGLNNARLNAVATYEHWVPAFAALIRENPDLKAFFRTAKALARMPRRERDAVLRALAPEVHEQTAAARAAP